MAKKKKLNDKQKKFCDCYLLCMNAAEAARQAGYSVKTADRIGYQNLRKLEIQEYIEERRKKTEEVVGISREKMLRSLELARDRSLEPSVVLDMWGNPVTMKIKLPKDKDDPDGEKGEKEVVAVVVKSDYRAAIAAVDQIAKYQGWHSPTKVQDVTESPLSTLGKKLFGTKEK